MNIPEIIKRWEDQRANIVLRNKYNYEFQKGRNLREKKLSFQKENQEGKIWIVQEKPGEIDFIEVQGGDNFKKEGMVNSVKYYRKVKYSYTILIDYTVFAG